MHVEFEYSITFIRNITLIVYEQYLCSGKLKHTHTHPDTLTGTYIYIGVERLWSFICKIG